MRTKELTCEPEVIRKLQKEGDGVRAQVGDPRLIRMVVISKGGTHQRRYSKHGAPGPLGGGLT